MHYGPTTDRLLDGKLHPIRPYRDPHKLTLEVAKKQKFKRILIL